MSDDVTLADTPPEREPDVVTDELVNSDVDSSEKDSLTEEGDAVKVETSESLGQKQEVKKSEDSSTSENESGKNDAETPKPKRRSAKKDIIKLRRRAQNAESRLAQLEAENAELKKNSVDKTEPKQEDFDDYDDYVDAKIDHKLKSNEPAESKQNEGGNQDQLSEYVVSKIGDVLADGKAKYEDFEGKVTNDDLQISSSVLEVAVEADDPAEVLYYLANNPDEAKRLSQITDIDTLAQEFEVLEETVAGSQEVIETKADNVTPEPKQPRQKTSRAPQPITPVSGKETAEKSLEEMPYEEYAAMRRKQERARR